MPDSELKTVMERAQDLARESGVTVLDLPHLALAALDLAERDIRRVLEEDCGIDIEGMVQRLAAAMPRRSPLASDHALAFSQDLKTLLDTMLDLRRATGADRFGMEHLCAAIFQSEHGAWRVFLEESGIDGDLVAQLVLERGSEILELEIEQIDVFSGELFGGNPAAVVALDAWLPTELMQAIAAENNLSETAFTVPTQGDDFHVRWFTPLQEVAFCGHATIAAARVLIDSGRVTGETIRFHSAAGQLSVTREGDLFVLEGPNLKPLPAEMPPGLDTKLGCQVLSVLLGGGDLVVVIEDEATLRELRPDLAAIAALEHRAVVVTAPGVAVDFVSRFFAPRVGVPEDPATGSAHCVLAPYWAERLDKTEMKAAQLSPRGGEMRCRVTADRVEVAGRTRRYLRGRIRVPRRFGD